MQAEVTLCQEEIVRRLEAVGLQATVSVVGPMAKGDAKFWSALLPTAEEQQALVALRAGYWPEWVDKLQGFATCMPSDVHRSRLMASATWGRKIEVTPIAALAAAGRALEEGEKRG